MKLHFSDNDKGFSGKLAWLAGVSSERLAETNEDDRIATVRTAIALSLAFVFISLVLCGAMRIAFPDWSVWSILPVAVIVAGLITAIDHAIVQSHWREVGERELIAFETGDPAPMNRQRTIVIGMRFLLSFALSASVAMFFDLLVYQKDIVAELHRQHVQTNAHSFARARSQANAELSELEREIERQQRIATAELESHGGEAKHAIRKFERQLAVAEAGIKTLTERESALVEAIAFERQNMDAELYGQKVNDGNTGQEGRGPRYAYHALQFEQLSAELEQVRDALTAKSAEREALQVPASTGPLPATIAERSKAIAALSQRKSDLMARQESRIAKLVGADPEFQPMPDGLITRLAALGVLLQPTLAKLMASAIFVLVMSIELGGVVVKLLAAAPGAYGVRTAVDARMATYQAMEDLQARQRQARKARAAAQAAAMFEQAMKD